MSQPPAVVSSSAATTQAAAAEALGDTSRRGESDRAIPAKGSLADPAAAESRHSPAPEEDPTTGLRTAFSVPTGLRDENTSQLYDVYRDYPGWVGMENYVSPSSQQLAGTSSTSAPPSETSASRTDAKALLSATQLMLATSDRTDGAGTDESTPVAHCSNTDGSDHANGANRPHQDEKLSLTRRW